jgi:hypothetical protein
MDGLPSIRYKKCVVLIVLHKYHPVVDIRQHTAVLQWSTCPRWYEAKSYLMENLLLRHHYLKQVVVTESRYDLNIQSPYLVVYSQFTLASREVRDQL